MAEITGRDVQVMIAGGLGGFTGMTFSEFVTEFVSRYFDLTGSMKLFVKGFLKFLFGLILWLIAGRFLGLTSLFFEVAGYGSIASIGVDLLEYVVPGGATGAAIASVMKLKGVPKEVSEIIESREEKVPVKARG